MTQKVTNWAPTVAKTLDLKINVVHISSPQTLLILRVLCLCNFSRFMYCYHLLRRECLPYRTVKILCPQCSLKLLDSSQRWIRLSSKQNVAYSSHNGGPATYLPVVLSRAACEFASLLVFSGPMAAITLTSASVGMGWSLIGSLVWSRRLYVIVVTPFFRSPDTKTASLRPPIRSSGHTPLFPLHYRRFKYKNYEFSFIKENAVLSYYIIKWHYV